MTEHESGAMVGLPRGTSNAVLYVVPRAADRFEMRVGDAVDGSSTAHRAKNVRMKIRGR
jgi:hypothetical protein